MAVKKEELRIGNWVGYKGGQVQIFGLIESHADITHIYVPYEDLNPIPLSPDVLERLGFKKGKIKITQSRYLQWSYGSEFWIENGDEDTLYEIDNITALHQLMNLYYSLTQTELIYNKNNKL